MLILHISWISFSFFVVFLGMFGGEVFLFSCEPNVENKYVWFDVNIDQMFG